MDRPRISVLIPVRNGEETIRRSLASVLAQSVGDFEVVVVDDHSTDATRKVLATMDDRRVRVLDAEGAGLVDALNQGLLNCRAAVVARLDADDWMLPDRLERQLRVLEGNLAVDLVTTPVTVFSQSGLELEVRPGFMTSDAMKLMLLKETGFSHTAVAYRLKTVMTVGGYRRDTFPAEDYDLWVRLAQLPGEWVGLDEPLTCIEVRSGSVSGRLARVQRSKASQIRRTARDSQLASLAHVETIKAELSVRPGLEASVHLARLQAAALAAAFPGGAQVRLRRLAPSLRAAATSVPALGAAVRRRARVAISSTCGRGSA